MTDGEGPVLPASGPLDDMTPRERVAYELLVLANLEKLVTAQQKRARKVAAEVFTRPGQREVAEVSPDPGDSLGDVRRDKQRSGWKVTNTKKLLAYCQEVWPEHVFTTTPEPYDTVTPTFVARLLEDLADGEPLVSAGDLPICDLDTGEVLTAPPGVEYVEDTDVHLVVTAAKGGPAALLRALGSNAALLGFQPELER